MSFHRSILWIEFTFAKNAQGAFWLSFALMGNMKSETKKFAFCGIFAAVSVVILFIASLTGIGTFAGPILASIVLTIVLTEYNKRSALLVYVTVSVLSLILMPDRELAAAYVCLAWYPIVRERVAQKKNMMLRILIKLLLYSVSIGLFYEGCLLVTGIRFGEGELPKTILWILFALGAVTFLITDKIYEKIGLLWAKKWRKNIF